MTETAKIIDLAQFREDRITDALTADLEPFILPALHLIRRHRLDKSEARRVFAALAEACHEKAI